jgi:hypothetical protein
MEKSIIKPIGTSEERAIASFMSAPVGPARSVLKEQ